MMIGMGLSLAAMRSGSGGPVLAYDGLCFALVSTAPAFDMGPVTQVDYDCFARGSIPFAIAQRGNCFEVVAVPPFVAATAFTQTSDFCFARAS